MNNFKISGCIVTYNNASIIEECISSILEYTKELDFQLYISDNQSTDETVSIVKEKFPTVIVIENKRNLGFGAGHNAVIPVIESDYHFVINPDIIMREDVMGPLTDFMEKRADVFMATPKIVNFDDTEQFLPKRKPSIRFLILSKFPPFKKYRKIYARELEHLDKPTVVEFCTGCFFGIKTKVFKEIGGFDDRYFMYFEDADLSRMICEKGKIVFVPNVSVCHEWHRENVKNIKGILRWLKSMVTYFNKWGWKF